jgi:outer membrane protein OmpA-like peptidoglycan-associated protein
MIRWSTPSLCPFALVLLAACAAPRQYTRLDPSTIDPPDVHLRFGHVIIDERILFALDSHAILPESAGILDHLAQFLVNHRAEVPSLEIVGHTDSQGTPEHNQILSERRAGAVRRALVQRGVESHLTAVGRGTSEPLCTEATEDCNQRNRRVDFIVAQ